MLSQIYPQNGETVKKLIVLCKTRFRLKRFKVCQARRLETAYPIWVSPQQVEGYKNHFKVKPLVKNIYVMEERRGVVIR